jgi:hypothetical protein
MSAWNACNFPVFLFVLGMTVGEFKLPDNPSVSFPPANKTE